jgi:hypothetical protein
VFKDGFALEWLDADLTYGEARFVITGMVDGRVLRVVTPNAMTEYELYRHAGQHDMSKENIYQSQPDR